MAREIILFVSGTLMMVAQAFCLYYAAWDAEGEAKKIPKSNIKYWRPIQFRLFLSTVALVISLCVLLLVR